MLVAGCRTPAPVLDFGPRGRIGDPGVALEALRSRIGRVRSVSGEGRLAIETPEGGGKVTALVAARAPDQVRIDAVTPLGPLSSFASDGTTWRLADFDQKAFLQGPAAQASAALLPVRVCLPELVALLLGEPVLPDGARAERLEVDEARAVYLLSLSVNGGVETVALDPATLRPLEFVLPERPGCGGYRASFNDFDGEQDLPVVVKVSSLDGRRSVAWKWREREPGAVVDDATFVLSVPEGFAPP